MGHKKAMLCIVLGMLISLSGHLFNWRRLRWPLYVQRI